MCLFWRDYAANARESSWILTLMTVKYFMLRVLQGTVVMGSRWGSELQFNSLNRFEYVADSLVRLHLNFTHIIRCFTCAFSSEWMYHYYQRRPILSCSLRLVWESSHRQWRTNAAKFICRMGVAATRKGCGSWYKRHYYWSVSSWFQAVPSPLHLLPQKSLS